MLNTIRHGAPTDKPTLLIAHGLFGSARNWGVISKRLSDEREVVAADMRNHGQSPQMATHSYPELGDDLAQVIDGRWDVLGHSMGGKAAMLLALTHPEKVGKLVVADIAPVPYQHTQTHNIDAMRAVDLSRVGSRADALAQLEGLEPGLAEFFLQSLDLKERRWRLNLDVLEAEMPKIVGFPEIDLPPFEGDTLFLSGAKSDYVRREYRDRIKELFPNARFAKLPDAGHWLHAEKPREFEAAVRTFLNM
ncbi:alpha/beta fold hydrolase [Loktanella sp. IMCC34160]|uniref:alpha/beta fold hydrolase n=1 Tax=Loktanella sp. IMCC34160 TaxID=2510646 RepID=UPI00101C4E2A|nr:alpha/beta fold hydrolase [Loktanella sp. IMCC34160]RYG89377.1 alpha/beta fold hydrolase [Loktanella sp. IMCC34160]